MKNYNLSEISTLPPDGAEKEDIKAKTNELKKELDEQQNRLYASSKYSILIILQGLDASGKDGAIKKVFSYVNPQGVNVKSFKKPTELELAHDFLWRIHKHTPEKGMIQIFNRSHYEDVLVTRVENIIDDVTAYKRFEIINSFEKSLEMTGTKILKFYLHLSKEEQLERFQERLEDPRKHWKYNPADLKTSSKWEQYMQVYQDVFEHCSKAIPWTIVPTDKNWWKEYVIISKLLETMKSLKLEYPKLDITS